MGIVQRQSLKNVIVNYVGILIGAISTLFIYPLDFKLYGEIQFCLSSAALLSSFFGMGNNIMIFKFFPSFRERKIKGFLTISFIYAILSTFLITLLLFAFKTPISQFLLLGGFDINALSANFYIIFPIAVLLLFNSVLTTQSYNFQRIVVPDILSNFSLKIILPILVLLGFYSILSFNTIGWLLIVIHLLMLIALYFYIRKINGLDFDFDVFKSIKWKEHFEMIRYMLYGAMNQVGNMLVFKIDIIMIGLLLSLDEVGYYSIFLFMASVISVPTKAVYRITGPIVSSAIQKNDWQEVNKIYKKFSSNLFTIGIVIFSVVWLNMHTILNVMTNGEHLKTFTFVFLLLGLTKVIDMATSLNFHIIAYSKFFRYNTLFIVILAILNIVFNLYFIDKIGLTGAALATFFSMIIYDILKTGLVYVKFKIIPFNWKFIVLCAFLALAILAPLFFETVFQSFVWAALFTLVFVFIFTFTIYRLNTSEEINSIIRKVFFIVLKKEIK